MGGGGGGRPTPPTPPPTLSYAPELVPFFRMSTLLPWNLDIAVSRGVVGGRGDGGRAARCNEG